MIAKGGRDFPLYLVAAIESNNKELLDYVNSRQFLVITRQLGLSVTSHHVESKAILPFLLGPNIGP